MHAIMEFLRSCCKEQLKIYNIIISKAALTFYYYFREYDAYDSVNLHR